MSSEIAERLVEKITGEPVRKVSVLEAVVDEELAEVRAVLALLVPHLHGKANIRVGTLLRQLDPKGTKTNEY